jgi:hypothetical protein
MGIFNGILAVPRTENSWNSVLNPSTEEKTTQNSVLWNKIKGTLGIPFGTIRRGENNRNSVPWNKNRRNPLGIPSEPFRGRLLFRPKPGPPGVYTFPMGQGAPL